MFHLAAPLDFLLHRMAELMTVKQVIFQTSQNKLSPILQSLSKCKFKGFLGASASGDDS